MRSESDALSPHTVGGAPVTAIELLDRSRGASRVALIAILIVGVVVIGAISTATAPAGSAVALWWPSAAVCVVVLLLVRRHRPIVIALLVAAVALSLLIGGRPLPASVGYAPFGVTEAWIVATVLSRGGRVMRLTSGRDVLLLVAVILGGAITAGVGIAVVAALSSLGAPLTTVFAVVASHCSALLVILPVLLTPIERMRERWGEKLAQALLLAICIIVVFRPGQTAPMSFLVFPFIAWAAFRFNTLFVAIELFLSSSFMLLLSTLGGGPFASSDGSELQLEVGLLQFFLISISSPALFLSALRSEQTERDGRVAERERLLTDGLVRAQVGFLLLERRNDGSIHVIEQNELARGLLPVDEAARLADSVEPAARLLCRVLAALDETEGEWGGELESDDGRHLEVHASSFSDGDRRLVTVDVSDVTFRRRAEDAVRAALESERAAADELRVLYRLQEEFVASISHELRTPLTSILGFAEGLRDDLEGEARAEVEVILRNARRLASLVEDLLDVGASDPAVAGSDHVAVDDIVRDCVEDQRIHAKALGVAVSVDLSASSARVASSTDAVTRIVTNLLSNAIKFATRPGRVEIASRIVGDRVEVVIRDDGPGIPERDSDRVFERFYRSTAPELARLPGTGLGLSIVRSLVEVLGGTVRLEPAVGGGTAARLELPLVRDAASE